MRKVRKRKKDISIIFISDEKKEPVSIKLSSTAFKSILISAGLVLFLMILGGVYYYKVIGILADYDNMKQKSRQTEEYKKLVYSVAKKFEGIEQKDKQIRKLLGVEKTDSNEEYDTKKPPAKNDAQDMKILSDEMKFALGRDGVEKVALEKYSISPRHIPYRIPVAGYITKDFQKDDLLTGESHTGIDIVAKEGSVIRSVADGVIVFSNWTHEWGNMIIVDHFSGFVSFYKHNKRHLIGEKDFVRKGQPIALMGNSGVSSGTHLHFELWRNGKPVDPKEYIINL
ncbi:M23 family metallopeptidase [bacterium]|nr:M23 family metallopeptidase [bacterium]